MNKTLTMKFIYILTVLSLLAMMIPATFVTVSAAPNPTLTMTIAGVTDGTTVNGKTEAYNVSGSLVTITVTGGTPISWTLTNITTQPGYGPAAFEPTPADNATVVYVRGIWGEAQIKADFGDNITRTVTKKWGMIDHTDIQAPGQKYVTWDEANKAWYASATIKDTVYADFVENGQFYNPENPIVKPAQGTLLNWYLVSGSLKLPLAAGAAQDLNAYYAGLAKAQYVEFINSAAAGFNPNNPSSNGWLGTGVIQTVTGVDGSSTVNIGAWFEENVQIVVVPEYPNDPNRTVTPELTSYNFETREMEVVPQVRWAGEKIALEANFGAGVTGNVNFYLQNQSVGTLEGINNDQEQSTIWTSVDDNGTAYAILKSSVSGQADVTAALYSPGDNSTMTNQYSFRVYFLNFESLTLSDVNGKRAGHNDGLWTTQNPFNDNFPDGYATTDITDTQTLNVSQDALERVQVRGWFVPPAGAQRSIRDAEAIDINGDGMIDNKDVMAPAGRWILPDDWASLAGYTNWQERRIHWDIMSDPSTKSGVTTHSPGNAISNYYLGNTLVSAANVVGPFAPGLEQMTPSGWAVPNIRTSNDPTRANIQTVVPDGLLNAWDAPMPPAKIILEIMSGPGYFKDAMKTDIYYIKTGSNIVYTNPFYQILIPASPLIPAFNKYGGYDWDSFDGVHGNYQFWTVLNQPDTGATPGDAQHPTKVEVYSDNHGEAMVWLNGNWNLNLQKYIGKGGADVPLDEEVGRTIVQASADYPYYRLDQAIFSNEVEKVWYWSGQILGTDSHDFGTYDGEPIGTPTDEMYSKMVLSAGSYIIRDNTTINDGIADNDLGQSNDAVVWVWATDRDGLMAGVLGTQVHWRIIGNAYITPVNADRISNYNDITRHIPLNNGFVVDALHNVPGTILDGAVRKLAISNLRQPTTYEKQLFHKKWPLLYTDATGVAPINFAVAAIDIYDSVDEDVTVETILTGPDYGYPGQTLGNVYYETNVDFNLDYPLDDPIVAGDANADGVVDAADITKVERIIMGLDATNVNADANGDGYIDMGDVVKISRIILKLD